MNRNVCDFEEQENNGDNFLEEAKGYNRNLTLRKISCKVIEILSELFTEEIFLFLKIHLEVDLNCEDLILK